MFWWITQILAVIFVTYNVAKNKKMLDKEKALWIVLTVVTGIVGGLIYFLVHQRKESKKNFARQRKKRK